VVPKVPALVIALPCTIDPDCTLGECTYPWQNDPDFLPRTLGHLDGTVRLINDAELAAMSAFLTGAASGRTFVITLGYGPGAALVDRRAGNQRRAT
jgi:predicted NBD/HSP70 family sugar kinase